MVPLAEQAAAPKDLASVRWEQSEAPTEALVEMAPEVSLGQEM